MSDDLSNKTLGDCTEKELFIIQIEALNTISMMLSNVFGHMFDKTRLKAKGTPERNSGVSKVDKTFYENPKDLVNRLIVNRQLKVPSEERYGGKNVDEMADRADVIEQQTNDFKETDKMLSDLEATAVAKETQASKDVAKVETESTSGDEENNESV
jgi:hypothetical protein